MSAVDVPKPRAITSLPSRTTATESPGMRSCGAFGVDALRELVDGRTRVPATRKDENGECEGELSHASHTAVRGKRFI